MAVALSLLKQVGVTNGRAVDIVYLVGPMEFLTRHVNQVSDRNEKPLLSPFGHSEHQQGIGSENAPSALDSKMLGTAASQLFRAMDGVGTDEKSIHRVLAGKSKEEIDAIRAIYADHYPGHELDKDLKSELSGTDLAEAQAALSGDPIQQAAAALQNAASGIGTDEQRIHDALVQINKLTEIDAKTGKAKDPAAREKLAAAFQHISGGSIDEMLQSELSGRDLKIARKEVQGDRAGADAIRLDAAMHGGFLGIGTSEQKIYEVLENTKDKSAFSRLLRAYEAETEHALSADLDSELSGAEKDLSSALLSEDRYAESAQARRAAQAQIAASRLAIASQGIGSNEDAIFKQFEGIHDGALREEIQVAFNNRYGKKAGGDGFEQMLFSELSGNDLERAKQLVRQGRMDPAFALKYAMDGAGTDEELIRNTIKRCKTTQELDALRQRYAALKNSTDRYLLDSDLTEEMSGRDGFEVKQLMAGAETQSLSARKKIAFANQAYEFERGVHAGAIGNLVTDLFSDSGKVLDIQHERLKVLNEKLKAGTTTEEDLARLQTVSEYHKEDVENYQAARDGITNTAAMGGTALVGTALTIATWGGAGPAVASVLGALAGGATNIGLKMGMQGDSYSTEDLATDVAMTLVSAATAGAVGPLSQVATRAAALLRSAPRLEMMVSEALKGGQMGLANGVVASLLDENTWRGADNGVLNFFQHVGSATLGGMTTGVATAGLARQMGPSVRRWNAFAGAAGGVTGGAAQAVVDGGGDLDSDAFLESFRNNGALNVLSGIALANLPHTQSHPMMELTQAPSVEAPETHGPVSKPRMPELNAQQKEVQSAELGFVGTQGGGNMGQKMYKFMRTLPNGSVEEYIFRPIDGVHRAAERFRKELAAYMLNEALGFDNGFPLAVGRELEVAGVSRDGWLQKMGGPTLDNKGGGGALRQMAAEKYEERGSSEVRKLLRDDHNLRDQAEQVLLERLLYGDHDDHGMNLIATSGPDGQTRLQNIDLEFGFSTEQTPRFGPGSDRGMAGVMREELGTQPLSPKNMQRLQRFVNQHESPAGQEQLQAMGLKAQEVSAMLSRANRLLEAGKLPPPVSFEDFFASLKQGKR